MSPAPLSLSEPLHLHPPVTPIIKSEREGANQIHSEDDMGNLQTNALTEVIKKQNEITEMLIIQQRFSSAIHRHSNSCW